MTTDFPSSETNIQRCQPGIVQRPSREVLEESTVEFLAGSDVTQTLPEGEQVVRFSGGGSGVSASVGAARSARKRASETFMASNA